MIVRMGILLTSTLIILAAAQDAKINLTNSEFQARAPRWAPDGTQILFDANRDGNWNI